MNFDTGANYLLIGKNKKAKTFIDIEKIPIVKEIVLRIIETDYDFWKSKNHIQLGIEKFNLLRKVSQEVKINSVIFEIAIEELEIENKILSFQEDNFKRYIKVNLNV